MKYLFTCILFSLLLQSGGNPIPVAILNPSFEVPLNLPYSTPCGNTEATYRIPGWTITPFQLPNGGGGGAIKWTCGPVPDGIAVAFLGNAKMSQDLGVRPFAGDGIYTMKLFFGNWFYFYSANYTVSLLVGTKAVCSASGLAMGDFEEVPLVCPAERFADSFQGNLGISIENHAEPYWSVLLDKVALTFTSNN